MRLWTLAKLTLLASLALTVMPGAEAAAPCTACHAESAAAFHTVPHGRALGDGVDDGTACAACHGDGSAHMANPAATDSILRFDEADAGVVNGACESCHEDTHAPGVNAHERAGLACTDCHGVHSAEQRPDLPADFAAVDDGSATCYACHQESFTQFQFNERHRLVEGSLRCADCHDPHAPEGGVRLGAFRDAVCAECHVDATGPFVYEHAASRVEGCNACHVPHGSPNRHLLTHQQVGELCYSCHALVPQFHLGFAPVGGPRFDERTVCTNCHVTIHGSNLDRNLLR